MPDTRQSFGGPDQLYLFCMSVEDNRAHRLSQMFFEKFLIPDYKGLGVVS